MMGLFNRNAAEVVTEKQVNALYQRPPSFTDWLPWVDFDPDTKCFTLEDGVSAGVLFEIVGIPTEARSEQFLRDVQVNIQTCINHTIPQKDNPFVLQCFVQDEDSLAHFAEDFEAYIPEAQKQSRLTQDVVARVKAHLKNVANPKGLFIDNAVTGGPWSGKQRRVRVCLYRRQLKNGKTAAADFGTVPEQEMVEIAEKFQVQMKSTGIQFRQCNDEDLYRWLVRWFNPQAEVTGGDVDALIELMQLPSESDKPFGFDLSSLMLTSQPESDDKGNWCFESMPHRAITIDALRRKPDVGHLTGERRIGDNLFAVFDRLPPGTVLAFTVTIEPQDFIENRITQILAASKGDSAEAITTEKDAVRALECLSNGDYLYPTVMTLFLQGDDTTDLQKRINEANALLLANGLHPVREKDELLPLNTYIRQLPMNYEPAREKLEKKSRLFFSSDLAKLLPFYGRSRGTNHPCINLFNRGGEPLVFDPLNKKDRSKNAFGLFLGPPGSGKSSIVVYLLMMIAAIHNARIFVIEKGGSFKLFGEYCKHFGLSVNQVTLHPKHDVSLPPFADAFLMLEREEQKERMLSGDYEESSLDDSDESDDNDEERDYLGEMELKARVMITGGDPKEEEMMTRADRLTIRKAIVNAAKNKRADIRQARKQNRTLTPKEEQVLTEDVVAAMNVLATDESVPPKRRERAQDMADAMELYCSGTAGRFFNRPGKEWPEADVTILEMGLLANDGYEDQLALAFMGLMNQINGVVEREQYSQRPTMVLGDESHLITTNPLLAIFLVKIVKMWRKLGAWLWLATQNMEDFPDAAKKLLSMFEFWFAMVCPKEQIEQIARFKDLTDEQKGLLLAAHKEPGKYTEGVVLSDKIQALFRNVPPPIALALAMTEKHEKRQRAKIMDEFGCDELEAVFKVANDISEKHSQVVH